MHETFYCPLLNVSIASGDCEDIQQARMGLMKKESIGVEAAWEKADEVCESCKECPYK